MVGSDLGAIGADMSTLVRFATELIALYSLGTMFACALHLLGTDFSLPIAIRKPGDWLWVALWVLATVLLVGCSAVSVRRPWGRIVAIGSSLALGTWFLATEFAQYPFIEWNTVIVSLLPLIYAILLSSQPVKRLFHQAERSR